VRLLLDDTLPTANYTVPIGEGWVTAPPEIDITLVPRLDARSVAAGDAAFLPASELLTLHQTHDVLTGAAVVADGAGTVAMRTPVRPDEIEATPVRLLDTSGTAELLARATLRSFYGITTTTWVRDADDAMAARAEVVIVDGAEALREPEGGYSEDLSRAWFILTAQTVVSHILLVPRDLPPDRRRTIADFLVAARTEGIARRRDWRPAYADREGIGRDRAGAFWAAQRLELTGADRHALLDLLRRGSQETTDSFARSVRFSNGAGVG
jgi:hypothetical protein